ncbi:MAG: hypothetical protein ACE5FZ_09115 [Nitrospiria bacterium]
MAALGVGLFATGMFLIVKSGLIKSWFILKTLPGLLSARMIYALLPIGAGFLFLSVAPSLPLYDRRLWDVWDTLFFLCEFLGFGFMIWPPQWIKPHWLQWLEREYGYCLDILIEEAQQMSRWDWETKVRTQKGMQAWIDEIFAKRREEIDLCWLQEKFYLVEQQMKREGRWEFEAGEVIRSGAPDHRRDEAILTQEDINEGSRIQRAMYRDFPSKR